MVHLVGFCYKNREVKMAGSDGEGEIRNANRNFVGKLC